jgi:hypothetical protein
MKQGRINKFTPRKFITQITFKKISKIKDIVIDNLIKEGAINIQTTDMDKFGDILLEQLGQFANEIKEYTVKNN